MPNVGDTTTHNASNNGTPTGTYGSWGINPGTNGSEYNITPGTGGTTSSITVQWLVAGNYSISVEATNACSSDIGFSPTIVVTGPPPCLLSISVSTSGSNINAFINSSNASDTVDISYNNGVSWSTGIDPIAIPNIVQSGFANGSYDVCVRQSSNFSCQQCQTVTVANCVPNWVAISGSNTCGQDVASHPTHPQSGLDACQTYLREEDGCGNSRWTAAFSSPGCPGCCNIAFNISDTTSTIFINTAGGGRNFNSAPVTGGSGNYTYNWNATLISGSGSGTIHQQISFTLGQYAVNINGNNTGSATLFIECTVVDNVTGCFAVRSANVPVDISF